MLLAEERLDLLIERLRTMGSGDRAAVLRLLSSAERRSVERLLRAPLHQGTMSSSQDGFSAKIRERIDGSQPARMTAAGREALARAVARRQPAAPPARDHSLLDAATAFARRGR